jgi:subtilisin family serine protease
MYQLKQIKLNSLVNLSRGSPKVIVGIIDGPVDIRHAAFDEIRPIIVNKDYDILCHHPETNNEACVHGTFITGILAAKRGLGTPSICPSCKFALRPIFYEYHKSSPQATPIDLSDAICETVDAGAKIINLSLGMGVPMGPVKQLEEACIHARNNDAIIVISAGNQHRIGGFSVLNNEWPIPVAACDQNNTPLAHSNLGISIGKYGIMAPGLNVRSTFPNNRYGIMTGTSIASAFVTGTIALLWSLFPSSSSTEIIYSIRKSSRSKSIIPPVLDAEAAFKMLNKT